MSRQSEFKYFNKYSPEKRRVIIKQKQFKKEKTVKTIEMNVYISHFPYSNSQRMPKSMCEMYINKSNIHWNLINF